MLADTRNKNGLMHHAMLNKKQEGPNAIAACPLVLFHCRFIMDFMCLLVPSCVRLSGLFGLAAKPAHLKRIFSPN